MNNNQIAKYSLKTSVSNGRAELRIAFTDLLEIQEGKILWQNSTIA